MRTNDLSGPTSYRKGQAGWVVEQTAESDHQTGRYSTIRSDDRRQFASGQQLSKDAPVLEKAVHRLLSGCQTGSYAPAPVGETDWAAGTE